MLKKHSQANFHSHFLSINIQKGICMLDLDHFQKNFKKLKEYGELVTTIYYQIYIACLASSNPVLLKTRVKKRNKFYLQVIDFLHLKGYVAITPYGNTDYVQIAPVIYEDQEFTKIKPLFSINDIDY